LKPMICRRFVVRAAPIAIAAALSVHVAAVAQSIDVKTVVAKAVAAEMHSFRNYIVRASGSRKGFWNGDR